MNSCPTEHWKVVPGFDGAIEASNKGRIRRALDRYGRPMSRVIPQFWNGPKGKYRFITISISGKVLGLLVHRLVAAAFHGVCPEGLECAHLDGCCTNNAESNLSWVSRSVNMAHKVKHGTQPRGETCYAHKLTEADVLRIDQDRSAGDTFGEIARKMGVSEVTVMDAFHRRTWKHLKKAA